ncbi:MAG: 3-alpha-hydroxysteroid dehydrogenase [Ideonella sp. MAG2]|nr:MAG: 3-alpha-hydroxysteroid dehydrogenase [Ideonella sp. MAG2]
MLQGKMIVVTGVSSGIGEKTAQLVRAHGAYVFGVDLKPPRPNLVDAFHRADLSKPEEIDDLVQHLPIGIDGLANIAGLPPTHAPAQVLKVNLVGLKYLTTALIPRMAVGASVVNLASLAGMDWAESLPAIKDSETLLFENVEEFCHRHGIQGARSYFFSKEALIAWTLQSRWSWRDQGIRMNAISPGPVRTPILADFLETLGARAEEDMNVMERPAQPSDIAPVVAFLLSDGAAWIRGSNLAVDGGMHSHLIALRAGLAEG